MREAEGEDDVVGHGEEAGVRPRGCCGGAGSMDGGGAVAPQSLGSLACVTHPVKVEVEQRGRSMRRGREDPTRIRCVCGAPGGEREQGAGEDEEQGGAARASGVSLRRRAEDGASRPRSGACTRERTGDGEIERGGDMVRWR